MYGVLAVKGNLTPLSGGVERQLTEEPLNFDRAAALQDIIERLEPFTGLDHIEVGSVFGSRILHRDGFLSGPQDRRQSAVLLGRSAPHL